MGINEYKEGWMVSRKKRRYKRLGECERVYNLCACRLEEELGNPRHLSLFFLLLQSASRPSMNISLVTFTQDREPCPMTQPPLPWQRLQYRYNKTCHLFSSLVREAARPHRGGTAERFEARCSPPALCRACVATGAWVWVCKAQAKIWRCCYIKQGLSVSVAL